MGNQPHRTIGGKINRSRLLNDLTILKQYGDLGSRLAGILLEQKQGCPEYEGTKRLKNNQMFNKSIREQIRKGDFDSVMNRSYIFNNKLDSETADMLSEAGYCERVWKHKTYFICLGNKTYDKFVEAGYKIEDIFVDIDRYEDHNHIINDLINRKIMFSMKLFKGLNKETFKKCLGSSWLKGMLFGAGIDENTFSGLDKESFVEMLNLVTPSNVMRLETVMKRFSGLDKESFIYVRNIYSEMEKTWPPSNREQFKKAILENIGLFKGLGVEQAELLIRDNSEHVVVQHPERFGLKKGE